MKNWKVNMLYPVISYFKFLLRSTNQHGVHSPFVFDLVTKCFYNKTPFSEYDRIKSYREGLIDNTDYLEVTDLGAGSRVFKSKRRKISSIAKHSGATLKEAKLLFRIANYFKPKKILELGTSLGIATHALSLGAPNSKITTIEGCPNLSKFATKQFIKSQINNINLVNNSFASVLPEFQSDSFDLIYFDGNHQKEATLSYFETLLPTTHNDSVWIFDDIYWRQEMTDAWNIIKEHPKVTVTIDTFNFGLVFFRKEQTKEHFIIRL